MFSDRWVTLQKRVTTLINCLFNRFPQRQPVTALMNLLLGGFKASTIANKTCRRRLPSILPFLKLAKVFVLLLSWVGRYFARSKWDCLQPNCLRLKIIHIYYFYVRSSSQTRGLSYWAHVSWNIIMFIWNWQHLVSCQLIYAALWQGLTRFNFPRTWTFSKVNIRTKSISVRSNSGKTLYSFFNK